MHSSRHFKMICIGGEGRASAWMMLRPCPLEGRPQEHFSKQLIPPSKHTEGVSRHETLNLIVATYSLAPTMGPASKVGQSASHCRLTSRLLAAPSFGQNHGGNACVALVCEALLRHPSRLCRKTLAARIAIAAGDGATSMGGEDHRHVSTKAAELFMDFLHARHLGHGEANFLRSTDWGLFHRVDTALKHAFNQSPAIQEVLELGKALGALFGVGEGRITLRSSARLLGERAQAVPEQGGTRKIVALMRTVQYILRNFATLAAAFHARIAQSQGPDRSSSQTTGALIASGRRLTSVDLVMFANVVEDSFRDTVVALALRAQDEETGAVQMWERTEEVLEIMAQRLIDLRSLRRWCNHHRLAKHFLPLLPRFAPGTCFALAELASRAWAAKGESSCSFFKGSRVSRPAAQGCSGARSQF